MKWLLLWAISGLAIALGYAVWRRWIAPWSRVENMIRQVARGERPRTFLINGGSAPRRVGLALEAISNLQQQLNHQIAERAVGTETIFAAMQDGLLVVDTRHRISLVNRSFRHLFGLGNSIVGHPILEIARIAHGQEPRFEPRKEAKGRLDNAKLDERFEWFQRVSEKFAAIKYARRSRPLQHVVGQNFRPQIFDRFRFRKKTMTTDVEVKSLVSGGARNAADVNWVGLQDGNIDVVLRKQVRRGQPRRSGSDDSDSCSHYF